MSFSKDTFQNGFTLVELLIVMAILGVIAVISLALLNPVGAFKKARDTQRKNDLQNMQSALSQYYLDYGVYPPGCNGYGVNEWSGEPTGYGGCKDNYVSFLVPQYIRKLPHDPQAGTDRTGTWSWCTQGETGYVYLSKTGSDYKLLAHCTPEGIISPTDAFYDITRATNPPYALQVSSPGGANY